MSNHHEAEGGGFESRSRVLVVGAGAMGSLLGAHLLRAGCDVTFLEKRPELVQALEQDGLEVRLPDGSSWRQPAKAVTDASALGRVDWIFLCVKAGDTEAAARQVCGLVEQGALLVSLQNGLGNREAVGRACGQAPLLVGTIAAGAYLEAPGRLVVAGMGPIVLGDPADPVSERVQDLADLLRRAGFDVNVERDIDRAIWDKLLVNVGINALTALLGVPNGALLELPGAERVMEAALSETLAVGRAAGVDLDLEQALERTRRVARATARNRSSMLSDILAGRKTEVGRINGAVAELGRRLGLATPVNRMLADLVEALGRASSDGLLVPERRWLPVGTEDEGGGPTP